MSLHHWKRFCNAELKLVNADEFVEHWWEVIESHMRITDKRPYHNLIHVADLFAMVNRFKIQNSISMGLAIYFHDIIYDPQSKESNEARSAEVLKEFASEARKHCNEEWLSQERVMDVATWILETARHISTTYTSPFSNEDFLLFLDCDMSILGSNRERYAKYSTDVRQEYIHISDADFIKGRSAFLNSLQHVPDENIFKTKIIRDELIAQARDNISWELASLSSNKL